jgi:hypothetical protein
MLHPYYEILQENSWHYTLSWCLLNHGLSLLQQKKKVVWLQFFQLSV